jgi:hypothetical protein
MAAEEVSSFLSHLARHEHVAASPQNQALSVAVVPVSPRTGVATAVDDVERAKRPTHLPTAPTVSETRLLLAATQATKTRRQR